MNFKSLGVTHHIGPRENHLELVSSNICVEGKYQYKTTDGKISVILESCQNAL